MRLKITHLKVHLLFFTLFSLSVSALAQAKSDNKELLQGSWVYENAHVQGLNREISLDLYNDYIEIYPDIEISQDVIILTDNEYKKVLKAKYEISKNYLGVEFPSGKSIIAEWAILDGKLYIEYPMADPTGEVKEVTVLLIYKRK